METHAGGRRTAAVHPEFKRQQVGHVVWPAERPPTPAHCWRGLLYVECDPQRDSELGERRGLVRADVVREDGLLARANPTHRDPK